MRTALASLGIWVAACGPSGAGTSSDSDSKAAATPAAYDSRLEVVEPPAGVGGIEGEHVVAARVFAFADSQLHYLFGKRTFAQSPFADITVEVAVRPAAQDDGADLLLRVFLDEWSHVYSDHTLVFLGDAADLSCEQEYQAFFAALSDSGLQELLSVTSNHDGFFVGNYTSRGDLGGRLALTDMPHEWTRACSEPGSKQDHRLTKGRAVQRLTGRLPTGEDWATEVRYEGADGPDDYANTYLYYARALGGADDGVAPAWGVFLDTVDYRGFDLKDTRGAGTVGAVSRDQLKFLDVAMFNARTNHSGGDPPPAFVLFAHYPTRTLDKSSRARVLDFIDNHPRIVGFVAAHAHKSYERTIELPSGRTVPEIVVGSTTDAPQHARRLEVHVDPKTGAVGLASWRLRLDLADECSDVEPLPSTSSGYTGYRLSRDDTGVPDIGSLRKLLVFAGVDDLGEKRIAQALGALLIENELVRGWAALYLDAPLRADRSELQRIADKRYAEADDFRSLRPWFSAEREPLPFGDYDAWQDPVIQHHMIIAQSAVHRFGPHAGSFQTLRELRGTTDESQRYFLCHAMFASQAEQRSRKTVQGITYVP